MASFYCCFQDGDICMGNSSDPWRSPENPKWLGGTGRSRGVISDVIKNVSMMSPQFKIWKNSRWQFAYDACDCMKLHSSRPLYTTHTGSLSFTITIKNSVFLLKSSKQHHGTVFKINHNFGSRKFRTRNAISISLIYLFSIFCP